MRARARSASEGPEVGERVGAGEGAIDGWEKRARDGGRAYGPREGAVPPCRPPAVRATRYHWSVMCVSLSRSHWYRSESFVNRVGGVATAAVTVRRRVVCDVR